MNIGDVQVQNPLVTSQPQKGIWKANNKLNNKFDSKY